MAEYRIVDRIGQGGMGIVYRAVQEPLDRPVAVKILPSSLMASSGTAVPRFLREIQACTKLNHPNIIRIIDCGEMSGQPFFAMEFLEAQTLRELLADNGPLPVSQATEIFRQMLEALEYCHSQGVIHRDIKPHNIMVDAVNHATLMDFGLVKMLERSGITQSRRIVGSPNYMPPEMIQGKDVGVQADIWSLGCVIYELLAGERAFPGKVIRDIGLLILKSEPVPITSKRPDTPAGLAQVIAGCLKKEPHERYLRAEHVLKDLQRIESGRPPLGPQAEGNSAAGMPAPKLEEVQTARATRKTARATRKEPVAATLVGLPPEPTGWRFSWRALIPRTWLERLVAAGLLVVVALGLIVGALMNASGPGQSEPALKVRMEVGTDFVELAWTSPDTYAAVVVAARADAGGDVLEVPEAAARAAHKVRVAGLERGVTYHLTVKAGERVVHRATARTLSPADLAERLERAIQKLEPAALAAKLEHDLAALTGPEKVPGSPRLEGVREQHRKAIGVKLAKNDVAGAVQRFRARRHDFFLEDAVPPARKRAVWMAVEALEDLRQLTLAAGIAGVPAAVDACKDAGFGPIPDAQIAGAQEIRASLAHAGGKDVLLYTKTGARDSVVMEGGPAANVSVDLLNPVEIPGSRKRVEVGLTLGPMAPTMRVTLWAGVGTAALVPVAVFRGSAAAGTSWFALDPRLVAGSSALRLELACSDAMTPFKSQKVAVRALTFRHTGGAP